MSDFEQREDNESTNEDQNTIIRSPDAIDESSGAKESEKTLENFDLDIQKNLEEFIKKTVTANDDDFSYLDSGTEYLLPSQSNDSKSFGLRESNLLKKSNSRPNSTLEAMRKSEALETPLPHHKADSPKAPEELIMAKNDIEAIRPEYQKDRFVDSDTNEDHPAEPNPPQNAAANHNRYEATPINNKNGQSDQNGLFFNMRSNSLKIESQRDSSYPKTHSLIVKNFDENRFSFGSSNTGGEGIHRSFSFNKHQFSNFSEKVDLGTIGEPIAEQVSFSEQNEFATQVSEGKQTLLKEFTASRPLEGNGDSGEVGGVGEGAGGDGGMIHVDYVEIEDEEQENIKFYEDVEQGENGVDNEGVAEEIDLSEFISNNGGDRNTKNSSEDAWMRENVTKSPSLGIEDSKQVSSKQKSKKSHDPNQEPQHTKNRSLSVDLGESGDQRPVYELPPETSEKGHSRAEDNKENNKGAEDNEEIHSEKTEHIITQSDDDMGQQSQEDLKSIETVDLRKKFGEGVLEITHNIKDKLVGVGGVDLGLRIGEGLGSVGKAFSFKQSSKEADRTSSMLKRVISDISLKNDSLGGGGGSEGGIVSGRRDYDDAVGILEEKMSENLLESTTNNKKLFSHLDDVEEADTQKDDIDAIIRAAQSPSPVNQLNFGRPSRPSTHSQPRTDQPEDDFSAAGEALRTQRSIRKSTEELSLHLIRHFLLGLENQRLINLYREKTEESNFLAIKLSEVLELLESSIKQPKEVIPFTEDCFKFDLERFLLGIEIERLTLQRNEGYEVINAYKQQIEENAYHERIAEMKLQESSKEIKRIRDKLRSQEAVISGLQSDVSAKIKELAQKEEIIKKKGETVESLKERIDKKDKELHSRKVEASNMKEVIKKLAAGQRSAREMKEKGVSTNSSLIDPQTKTSVRLIVPSKNDSKGYSTSREILDQEPIESYRSMAQKQEAAVRRREESEKKAENREIKSKAENRRDSKSSVVSIHGQKAKQAQEISQKSASGTTKGLKVSYPLSLILGSKAEKDTSARVKILEERLTELAKQNIFLKLKIKKYKKSRKFEPSTTTQQFKRSQELLSKTRRAYQKRFEDLNQLLQAETKKVAESERKRKEAIDRNLQLLLKITELSKKTKARSESRASTIGAITSKMTKSEEKTQKPVFITYKATTKPKMKAIETGAGAQPEELSSDLASTFRSPRNNIYNQTPINGTSLSRLQIPGTKTDLSSDSLSFSNILNNGRNSHPEKEPSGPYFQKMLQTKENEVKQAYKIIQEKAKLLDEELMRSLHYQSKIAQLEDDRKVMGKQIKTLRGLFGKK